MHWNWLNCARQLRLLRCAQKFASWTRSQSNIRWINERHVQVIYIHISFFLCINYLLFIELSVQYEFIMPCWAKYTKIKTVKKICNKKYDFVLKQLMVFVYHFEHSGSRKCTAFLLIRHNKLHEKKAINTNGYKYKLIIRSRKHTQCPVRPRDTRTVNLCAALLFFAYLR